MVEPVILTDEILAAADELAAQYTAHWEDWEESEPLIHVYDKELVSPVDGVKRRVRFLLSPHIRTKGKTVCGICDLEGNVVGGGNTIVLNNKMIEANDPFMAILIHEIIHAVDPVFEDEWRVLNPDGHKLRQLSRNEQYRLVHEQRAFPGMWIGCLREELANGEYLNPDASLARFRKASAEFDWFCRDTPDLAEQTREHVRLIVDDLRRRRDGSVSTVPVEG